MPHEERNTGRQQLQQEALELLVTQEKDAQIAASAEAKAKPDSVKVQWVNLKESDVDAKVDEDAELNAVGCEPLTDEEKRHKAAAEATEAQFAEVAKMQEAELKRVVPRTEYLPLLPALQNLKLTPEIVPTFAALYQMLFFWQAEATDTMFTLAALNTQLPPGKDTVTDLLNVTPGARWPVSGLR